TKQTPLLTTKAKDESGRQWDARDGSGLRFQKGIKNVEYFRDLKPLLQRSCVACHTRHSDSPAGKLVLDADGESGQAENVGRRPGPSTGPGAAGGANSGYKPVGYDGWGYPQASRYVRMFQSRRSLLVWKVFGERLDGFRNDDPPSEPLPGA